MITANLMLLVVFVFLMMIGTPIAVALGIGGVVGVYLGLDLTAMGMIGPNTYAAIAKYPLIAIPLFILTGAVFERSGVAARLVEFAQAMIGPRRGGLALVAILVCMIMGGMSGSGPADAAAVATVMLPSMVKAGYPKPFTASVIAASASTAILIPPSIAMIVYSVIIPGMDLRALFAAGLIPGIMLGAAVAVPTLILSRKHDFGAQESTERPPFWPSLRRAVPGLMAPVIILGGLRSGLFTPTETAVVAVAYGLFVGTVLYRTMTLRDVYNVLADSAKISGVLMLILSLAGLFAWAGSTMGAFDATTQALLSVSDNQWVILVLLMLIMLLAGMVLDGVSIYLIALPLLVPIVQAFGWSYVWFGVVMAINIAMGQFTPPVAVNLMVTAKVANVPLESTFRWVGWLLLAMAVALGLILAFPEIALWLPRLLGYRIT
ncbi:TRAP transporter large permease [Chachezhania antarctica]|uniref:TRAP transporter large permease n=1 Tax=Chachezhania antarctica TaxID=2340860 RepID=UPI0019690E6F|nr:TRAP transporter large permease [Chachezhania antarctica]|tara:strand:- start:182 stop:1483 length:1302 start_codon:yes stop_codon:yes gene_type:complete